MPLISCKLTNSTGPKLQGQPDRSITGEIVETYQIFTDDRTERELVIESYIPGAIFDFFPGSNMFISTFRDVEFKRLVTQPFSGAEWEGTIKYTRRARTKPTAPQEPSAADPYTIAFNFANRQEVLEVDRFGFVVKNTVGDKFDTPPMARVNEPTFTISRTEYYNPIAKIMNFNPKYGAVNASAIWGFNPRTLMLNIGADYNSASGWNVKYQFAFNYDTWDYSTLNAGYYMIEAAKRVRIVDETDDKRPIQSPKALAANGTILPDNTPGYFLFWEKAVPLEFHDLNLPNITTVW